MTAGGCAHKASRPLGPPTPPKMVLGWVQDGPETVYGPDELYDYINGSAEVYRAFNVREVYARRYVKEGAEDILADIFDMGSPADAFGAYRHDMRDGPSAGIGNDSESMGSSLAFWKGRYFVSIVSFADSIEGRDAVLTLGRAIAAGISETGSAPEILALLPQHGLVKSNIHYFHTHVCLNVYYFLANENLLNLSLDTEGILARYRRPDSAGGEFHYVLILIQYPEEAAAIAALDRFIAGYMPDANASGVVQTENGLRTGMRRHGRHLAGVFDAPSQSHLEEALREAAQALGGTKPWSRNI